MSITQVSTFVIEDGSITKAKLDLSTGSASAGQVLAIDGSDSFYFTDRFVAEEIDDRVAALINAGTHSNISIVYDDVANTLSFSATGSVSSVNGQTGIVVLDTDDILEGSTNLYYTTSRVLGEFSADGDLSYDSANGIFSVTTYKSTDFDTDFSSKTTDNLTEGTTNRYYTDTRSRNSISVTDTGGDGSLTYNTLTGVITYTGPSASEVYAHFSAGTGVSITNGQISIGQAVATTSNVTFNNMTVSGNLTINGTTTTVNTETLDVADNIITLNSDWDANIAPTQDAGIEVNRGTESNASWTWNETGDYWIPSHKIDMGGLTVTNLATPIQNSDAATKEYVDSVSSNVGSLTTDDITEGLTNLYFTDERAQDAMANALVAGTNIDINYDDANNIVTITANGLTGSTTDDLTEGTTNLYFTNERVDDRVGDLLVSGSNIEIIYDDANGVITINSIAGLAGYDLSANNTDDLAEGLINLYFTETRARDALSVSGDLSYDSANGIISFTERTDSEVLGLFSASGDLSYDEPNGIFSVTTYKSTDFDTDFSSKTTDDLTEGTSNLYYTDARARQSISVSDSTGLVSYDNLTGIVTIEQIPSNVFYGYFSATNGVEFDDILGEFSLDSSYSPTFVDMILTGNLTVQGTTTTVNTEQLLVADNIITLNSDVTGIPSENAGIEVDRGTLNTVGIRWNETIDAWQFSNDGITYQNIGSLSASDTDDLAEGTTNLYFTDERAQDAIANVMVGGNNITFTYDDANNIMTIDSDISSTDDLPEGSTNLYYTDSRWDDKMALADTDDLTEGTSNLYYTQTRVDDRVDILRTELAGDGTGEVHFNNLTNVPTVQTQVVVGNGTTTDYTLNSDPGSAAGLIITLNGVTQEPISDYTVSGTTLSFNSALPNGQRALIRYVGYQISGGTIVSATDSDLLDGLDSTQFLRSDTDDTMVGNLTMTGNIIPSANVTYNLGSSTNRWNELWLSTTTVNIGDNALSADGNNNMLWNSTQVILADVNTDIIPDTDNTYDLGSPTKQFASVYGHAIEATYADLAERYEIDFETDVGSVVVFGGEKEITLCKQSADVSVAGVISTDPAFKMNSNAGDDATHPYVALRGRVPCKIVGPVRKGDLIVTSSVHGFGKSVGKVDMGHAVFAKSLVEDLSEGQKVIEVVIV